jgi:VIT1/CCC1 family predicted Fe2+/Mn2+ transporter
MPSTPHAEKHFTASATVRDVVIGMSDGLTVPFALAAGLSGAVAGTRLILTAGGAEIAAGALAMGLGGYLAARTDRDHYHSEVAREHRETQEIPDEERREVAEIFHQYGLTDQELAPMLDALTRDPRRWVDFMMRFELGLEAPDPGREVKSALTIALSYVVGGLIPLLPYMLLADMQSALLTSVVVTLVALFVFGAVKGGFTGVAPLRSGLQTLLVGGLAGGAAFALARLLA